VATGNLSFTYYVADAVGFGSTAFRVGGVDSPVIYIEAFPDTSACLYDPLAITRADLIIQGVHGHATHYDPDICATVATNSGALVLGNGDLASDMLARGIPAGKIIELSPVPGKRVATTIESLGLTVTAYRMEHTMMPGTYLDTYLVEMADGTRWYHGTCSSGPETLRWMLSYPELNNLDVMIIDCDMDFADLKARFQPAVMIRTHDFKTEIKPTPATVFTDFPAGEIVLHNGQSWLFRSPLTD
jgi:hypothetical protein